MQSLWKTTRALALAFVLCSLTLPTHAADLDKLAPVDAEAVMVINFKNFLDSPLFKKYGEEAMKAALQDERAQKLLDATGIDPMKDLTTLTVTFTGGQADPKAAVILKGNFNVAKIQTTIEKEANKAGEKLKISKEGGLTYYAMTNPQGQEFTATFMGNDAMVMSNNKAYLTAIVGGKKGEATEGAKILSSTLKGMGGKETAFMAVAITKEMKDKLSMIPNSPVSDLMPKLNALSGAMNLTQSVDLSLALETTDNATAKQLDQILNGLKPLARTFGAGNPDAKRIIEPLLQNLTIKSEGNSVAARLQLTEELMKKLAPGGN